MLRLRHSLRPCIEALDAPSAKYSLLRRNAPSITFFHAQRRLLQTAAQSPSRRAVEPPDHWKQSAQAARHKQQERAALREQRSKNGVANVPTDSPLKLGRRDPSMSDKDWNNRKRELQHLRDPLELANFVEKELGKGRLKEMLQLVKMASYSMQCVVSFNHLINHYLAKGRVSDAWKIYNDMKKRAQFPDSYTYTIILRGFSRNVQDSGVMEKTLSVYHSLYAPNSRVEPSIIHTNAALRVCARALDMDALWGIAARIPENGPASANARTYVTILNALRQSLLIGGEKGESEEKLAARRESAIVEGRRLWEGIIRRWRNADIVMDEELVCAMGRLLLIGRRPRDWDDVLSLVQQTMDLPRLVPRLGTAEREKADVPRLRATSVPPQYRYDDDHLSPNMEPMRGEEFLPLIPPGVGNVVSNSLNYATPGNNTLSLVLEACQKVVAAKAADQYWDLLTDSHTYAVVPDINNLNMRLRLLRQNRASAAALELLKEGFVGKENQPGPGTFRIAMSTCFRDKNNHNSLKHASQILRIMSSTLEDADPKVVSIYAALATAFPLAKAQDYIDALTHLHPIVKNLRLQLGVGVAEKPGSRAGATYRKGKEREETIEAIQKVYGLYDKLLHSHMIAEEQKSPFKAERARLSAFIQRIKFKNENKAWHMAGDPSEAKSSKQNELEGEGKSDV